MNRANGLLYPRLHPPPTVKHRTKIKHLFQTILKETTSAESEEIDHPCNPTRPEQAEPRWCDAQNYGKAQPPVQYTTPHEMWTIFSRGRWTVDYGFGSAGFSDRGFQPGFSTGLPRARWCMDSRACIASAVSGPAHTGGEVPPHRLLPGDSNAGCGTNAGPAITAARRPERPNNPVPVQFPAPVRCAPLYPANSQPPRHGPAVP